MVLDLSMKNVDLLIHFLDFTERVCEVLTGPGASSALLPRPIWLAADG